MGFNQREYQTVILAALLHDIGKFLNRADNVRRKHPLFSYDYVASDDFKDLVKPEWIDIDLLKILVQRHHEYPKMADVLLVQKIEDPHTRALAYIVSRADTFSSGERLDEEPSELDFKDARLKSILTRVNIDKGDPSPRYYNLQRLSPQAIFPVPESELTQLSHHYERLTKEFGEEYAHFNPKDFSSLFNGYLSLFEEFLWCVPSDTRDKYNDVSLYDHLSTTSAIAACLYHYHGSNIEEKGITSDDIERFMLIGGDLSGIQRFIFEIGSSNPKKLSKILRGRSFYLSLLTEVVSLKFLRRLNLPLTCRIMNAGGRFSLLVPNTQIVREEVAALTNEIENWFYKKFLGKLSLNIACGGTLSKWDFRSEGFSKKNRELIKQLELAKKQRFTGIIKGEGDLFDGVMRDAHKALQRDNGACEFCGIFPKNEHEDFCQLCTDSLAVGEGIVSESTPFLYFYEGEGKGQIDILGYSLSFTDNADDWVLLEKIGKTERGENWGFVRRYICNYIPESKNGDIDFYCEVPEVGNTLCRFCGSPCKLEEDNQTGIPPRKRLVEKHLTFQCISALSRRENNGKGVDHLAVIKADVDDLGLIFSIGLGDALSISRYASLSRMLNYFFTGWLTDEIKKNYPMTYTVYAGGDDLLLIAPWECALNLGIRIGSRFRYFAGENPNVTISMGINLMRPSSPVRLATEGAENYLAKSKSDRPPAKCIKMCRNLEEKDKKEFKKITGKNSLTVFDTTVEWKDVKQLEDLKNSLNLAIQEEDSKVNISSIYRLLKYHEMYKTFAEQGFVEGLKFHSLMSRDVRRNIEKRDKTGKTINQDFINLIQPLYEIGEGFDEQLMINLKLPVFWTLYKNRRGGRWR